MQRIANASEIFAAFAANTIDCRANFPASAAGRFSVGRICRPRKPCDVVTLALKHPAIDDSQDIGGRMAACGQAMGEATASKAIVERAMASRLFDHLEIGT
ncbi:hypothetical protein FHY18_000183 [Xanthomonas arboricola]|uniref:hypothetical protein n=1 Tax=Xanthomonas sp. 3793 TaxID=3035312 RepID=UPI002169C24E|nr:hypothetical protein [Xanthomonas sp. 3793]MCS3744653.1 hypothetical protein [Xanthomonas sp. 3793]